MKTKKILALLLSICMASTLAFTACEDEESSVSEQGGSESVVVSNSDASESDEESSAPEQSNSSENNESSAPEQSNSSANEETESPAPEQSESENSESNESSTSEVPEQSSSSENNEPEEGMSETEWRALFTKANFANVTVTDSESQVLFDGTKCSMIADAMTMYLEEDNGALYVYMNMSGSYTKSPASSLGMPYTSISDVLPISVTDIANKYAEFTYVDGKYVSSSCTLTIENGKLVSCVNTEGTFTFSNYGTTSVTLPVVSATPDVKGDGIISANEFAAALSASSFTNVKMTSRLLSEDLSETTTIWYDGSNILKIHGRFNGVLDGEPFSIITTQYYVNNNDSVKAYVCIPKYSNDYVIVDSNINVWNTFMENLTSCSRYVDFYPYFTFNGLIATFNVGTNALTLTFNENEQLVSYSDTDGDTFISYSDYGTVSYSLPTNIYNPNA